MSYFEGLVGQNISNQLRWIALKFESTHLYQSTKEDCSQCETSKHQLRSYYASDVQ